MKIIKTSVPIAAIGAVLLLFNLAGCESAPSKPRPEPTGDYRFTGGAVLDPNVDSVRVVAKLTKDGVAYSGGTIQFDDSLLQAAFVQYFADSGYFFTDAPSSAYPTKITRVRVTDTSGFAESLLVGLPDTFVITSVSPFNRQIAGDPRTASLEWSTTANADGFILAAVKASRAYTGTGWSKYVQTFGSAGVIEPPAFLMPDSLNPDTGLFNVYVYAYFGSPDSALTAQLLPVPLPDQRPDNVAVSNFSGRFGIVTITFRDTVRVVQQ